MAKHAMECDPVSPGVHVHTGNHGCCTDCSNRASSEFFRTNPVQDDAGIGEGEVSE